MGCRSPATEQVDGLVHVSQISEDFVSDVAETGIKVGDEVKVPARGAACVGHGQTRCLKCGAKHDFRYAGGAMRHCVRCFQNQWIPKLKIKNSKVRSRFIKFQT